MIFLIAFDLLFLKRNCSVEVSSICPIKHIGCILFPTFLTVELCTNSSGRCVTPIPITPGISNCQFFITWHFLEDVTLAYSFELV